MGGRVARAGAVVVLAKGDIQDPVVVVFDARRQRTIWNRCLTLGSRLRMKQRTSAVTRSPQQRSYVTQIRLARWHYSRSEPRSLGRMDQQQSCWTVGRARTCVRPTKSGAEPQRQGPKAASGLWEAQFSGLGGHISSLSAPTKSDHVDGAATSPGVCKPFRGSTASRVFFPVCRNQDAV